MSRLAIALLEIDKSATKAWLSAESCWSDQFSINIWLEALSNLFDCILHLTLFKSILCIDFFRWIQVRIVVIILMDVYKLVWHAWTEDLLELGKGQIPLISRIN